MLGDDVVREPLDGSIRHDAAFFEDAEVTGHAPGKRQVVVDQQQRDAERGVQIAQDGPYLVDECGLNPVGRLVQDQQLRFAHQRPANRELLAFTGRVRYAIVALKRHGEVHGYAVYRHRHEPLGRVTMLVDFLVDPDDVSGLKTLLRWVDREARAEDSDKVRCSVMNGAFRRVLRRNGYFNVKSTLEVSVKVNAVQVPRGFYDSTEGWHITSGDSEQDR